MRSDFASGLSREGWLDNLSYNREFDTGDK